jgi:ABC-type Na+ efflux pump permease subunit
MEKSNILLVLIFLFPVMFTSAFAQSRVRIGTFDSRAVAIAYGNSAEGMAVVNNFRSELKKAKSAKNDSLVQRIEKIGPQYPVLSHLRAFSTGSVAEILAGHLADVDAIAQAARVQAIVSRFELIQRDANIDTVDVTSSLVRLFKPSERVLQWISGIGNQAPLSQLDVLMIPPEK